MPSTGQIAAMLGAVGATAYLVMRHQQNKNSLDKASDRWESAKADARLRASSADRPLADTMSDSAKSAYYDAKIRAQQTK